MLDTLLDFVTKLTDNQILALLFCGSISISVIAILLVQRFVPLHIRLNDNDMMANTISLIAVIYGVLVGLTALYLINNNSYTEETVQHEASAVANIYRNSKWLQEPTQTQMIQNIKAYIEEVIDDEWPLMRNGDIPQHDTKGTQIIEQITSDLIHYQGHSNSEMLLVHDIMDDIRDLSNARQQRIFMSTQKLSYELWLVVILGTILTLCTNYLVGMNFYLHLVSIVTAALITSSMMFLLITLDRPFQGEFALDPNSLISIKKSVDNYLEKHSKNLTTKTQ